MTPRFLIAALMAAALTVAVAIPMLGPATLQAAPAGAPVNRCQNIQLNATFVRSSGAAGTIVNMYRLRNLSGSTCTLYGYPGAIMAGNNWVTIYTVVQRGGGFAIVNKRPHTVRLAPGGSAYFVLQYSDVQSPGQTCPRAKYLMIFAPNNHLPIVTYAAPGGVAPCGGKFIASPVQAQPFTL